MGSRGVGTLLQSPTHQTKKWLMVEKATAAEGRGGYCWVPAGVKRNRVLGA